jgi:tRNA-2-methylthio-N6-dimethylallyladenosine synthase
MNRNYTVESYINKVERLRKYNNKINLTTDIIVGFPGESESDYNETYNLIKKVKFDDAFMYKYNTRSGTKAYEKYKDDVSDEEKKRRLAEIIDLQRKISYKNKENRINDEFEVISERWSKNSKKEILGLTKEDLMIIYNDDKYDFDKIIKVKAKKLEGGTLFGEKIN